MKRILYALALLACIAGSRAASLNEIQVEPLSFGSLVGSTYINDYALAAATNKAITVPTGARWAFFSCNTDVWVRYDGTAASVPAADITDGTGQELNPSHRYIRNVTTINAIAATAGVCSIVFFKQTP